MDPIPEHGPNAPSMAPPQLHTAAPVTQAARNFVDHTNEPAAARRLRKQQEMAQRKGRRGARFVQLGAHNACNIALPPHIQQVGSGQGERIYHGAGSPGSPVAITFSRGGSWTRS